MASLLAASLLTAHLSGVASASTEPLVPPSPTNIQATQVTQTKAVISWTPGADNGCPVWGYRVTLDPSKYLLDKSPVEFEEWIYTRTKGDTSTRVAATGLRPNTKYQVLVSVVPVVPVTSAKCANRLNLTYGSSFTTLKPASTVPPSPTNIQATQITQTKAVISWTPGADNGCPVWGYRVTLDPIKYQLDKSPVEFEEWIYTRTKQDTSTRVAATGLRPNTKYQVLVSVAPVVPATNPKCHNRFNLTYGGSFTTLKPTLPAAPTGTKLTSITPTTALISWEAGTSTGCEPDQYQVMVMPLLQPEQRGHGTLILNTRVPGNTFSLKVTGLTPEAQHRVWVAAHGASDDLGCIQQQLAQPQAAINTFATPALYPTPIPGFPTFTQVTGTSATMTWTPGDSTGCVVQAYRIYVWREPWRVSHAPLIEKEVAGNVLTTTITGLKPDTGHRVSLEPHGNADCGQRYLVGGSFTTKKIPLVRPATIDWMGIAVTRSTSVDIKWGLRPATACPVTSQHLRIQPAGQHRATPIVDVRLGAETAYRATGLKSNTAYMVKITTHGSGWACLNPHTTSRISFRTAADNSGSGAQSVGTVTEDPIISASDVSVAEGDSGETDMVFTVTLSSSPIHQVSITATAWARDEADKAKGGRSAGLGGAGRDFMMFRNQKLVWEAGATGDALTKTVTVKILGDEVPEDHETLKLRLNNLRTDDTRVSFLGGEQRLEVTGTILDDDAHDAVGHTISVSDVTVEEGDSGKTDMIFTVTLNSSPSHRVSLRATAFGSDTSSARFAEAPTATGGKYADFYHFHKLRTVVFEAGATGAALTQTVTVTVYGDTEVEEDETLVLWLDNLRTDDTRVQFASGSKHHMQATGTIVNDDESEATVGEKSGSESLSDADETLG
ncbi:fibronectin type III domain-containing protein [Candidatus Poriferisodalis sp.]|uniref:fibronectin type III domain-containing protein n=1 Tax=Candidatus Poriferisodalis sp. TaxID=3101277 RepID=UPI003B022735